MSELVKFKSYLIVFFYYIVIMVNDLIVDIIINGDSDYHMNTIVDMLENRSISRKVSIL